MLHNYHQQPGNFGAFLHIKKIFIVTNLSENEYGRTKL